MSPTDFSFEPFYLVVAAVLVFAYARTQPTGRWRIASFAAGVFLLAAPLNSPMETIAAKRLLLIHLVQNALIADIAPVLILLGLTPQMKKWLDAHGARRVRARWAIVAWLAAWYGTHLAGFYDWALKTGWGLDIEHGLLIAGGFLFWWTIVSERLPVPLALAYLGAAFVASSFLGLAFIFSSHPFYSFYEHVPRLWGFSPTRDQNLGGIAMNGEQTLVFLVAIGYYVSKLLSEESAER
ncbi:MAG: cytochrome c oxidase assembly protein [Gaiellaceae bacterium]